MRPETLSKRQRQVLNLLCEGLTNKEIAHRLSLSYGTVKVHVSDVLSKIGARDRLQAVVMTLCRTR